MGYKSNFGSSIFNEYYSFRIRWKRHQDFLGLASANHFLNTALHRVEFIEEEKMLIICSWMHETISFDSNSRRKFDHWRSFSKNCSIPIARPIILLPHLQSIFQLGPTWENVGGNIRVEMVARITSKLATCLGKTSLLDYTLHTRDGLLHTRNDHSTSMPI